MSSRQFCDEMMNDPSTQHGRRFMLFINLLIVISMVTFSLSTLPNLTDEQADILDDFEVFIIVTFTIEYLARLYLAKKRLGFALSFFGMIDLLSILPYYLFLFTGIDTRALRVARVFRMLRLFKLFRYSKSITRLKNAFLFIKDELVLFGGVATALLFASSVGIYYFEHDAQPDKFESVFDGLWWSIVTLTTVGYGDSFPITAGGKIFTAIVVLIGIGVVAVPTGLMVSGLQEARKFTE